MKSPDELLLMLPAMTCGRTVRSLGGLLGVGD